MKVKYRPFKNIDEFYFITGFHVGSCVLLRVKDLNGIIVSESETLITDIETIYDNKTREVLDYMIYLGTNHYQFSELLNTFEYFSFLTKKWEPFGVEE